MGTRNTRNPRIRGGHLVFCRSAIKAGNAGAYTASPTYGRISGRRHRYLAALPRHLPARRKGSEHGAAQTYKRHTDAKRRSSATAKWGRPAHHHYRRVSKRHRKVSRRRIHTQYELHQLQALARRRDRVLDRERRTRGILPLVGIV